MGEERADICGTRLLHQMPQQMDNGMHMLGSGMNQVEELND
jgi:hypothetical protein